MTKKSNQTDPTERIKMSDGLEVKQVQAYKTSDGEIFNKEDEAIAHQDKLNLRIMILEWLESMDTSVSFHSGNFEFAYYMTEDKQAMDAFYCFIQKLKDAQII